jgi:hypothetical protein
VAGLDPAIHVFIPIRSTRRGPVDARTKSGHDELLSAVCHLNAVAFAVGSLRKVY